MKRDGSFWFEAESTFDGPGAPCRCTIDGEAMWSSWSTTVTVTPAPDYLARAALLSPEPRHLRLVASNGKLVER